MLGLQFPNLHRYRDPALTTAAVLRMRARGEMNQREAQDVLAQLRQEGLFDAPMSQAHRELLAVLTRAAAIRPRLVVDNTRRWSVIGL